MDLKTIHNWVDRDQIKHFRTPGRHLRFKRSDIYDFLKKFDYPVPAELMPRKTAIFVLADEPSVSQAVSKQMGAAEAVKVFDDVLELMMNVGETAPEALVIDAEALDVELSRVHRVLVGSQKTRGCKVIVIFDDSRPVAPSDRTLAHAWVPRNSVRELRSALDTVLDY